LDPLQARSLRDALAAVRGAQTLVVSSHNLDELERLCDWVVMMDRGRCLRQGSVAEVTGREQELIWELGPGEVPLAALRARLAGHAFTLEARALAQRVPAGADPDAAALVVMEVLVAHRVPVRGLRRGASLEQRFLDQAAG